MRSEVAGFTLVELMITIAVAAILIALATPSFSNLIARNQLTGQSNALVGALQVARAEAVRRNARVIVCRGNAAMTACENGGAWATWVVGVDTDNDNDIDEVLQVGEVAGSVQIQDSAAVVNGQVIFRADGFAYESDGDPLAAQLSVCLPNDRIQNVRLVSIEAGTRIDTATVDDDGACDVPTDS